MPDANTTIDLAQTIRIVDGNHSLGAAALADAILDSDWYAAEKRKWQAEALREAAEIARSWSFNGFGFTPEERQHAVNIAAHIERIARERAE